MTSRAKLEAWRTLGPLLEQLADDRERALRIARQEHVSQILDLSGVSAEDPMREAVTRPRLDVWQGDVDLAMGSGLFGPRVRELFDEVAIARDLLGTWRTVNESIEDLDDPWESFWEDVVASRPEAPEEADDRLGELAEEIATAEDAASSWPLVDLGESASNVVAGALDHVAGRVGIARGDVPVAPAPTALDERAMAPTVAASALYTVHEWASRRERWARVLGRIAPYLRPPARFG